jgi:hypothetical protein
MMIVNRSIIVTAIACGLGTMSMASAETTDEKLKRLEAELNELAEAVDNSASNKEASRTKIGGYGELHYNNLESDDASKTKNELDFHRFVLFVSHDFNDKTRFFSEMELEHSIAGDGKKGEIELEQAYIEHDITDNLQGKAGLMILPVGIINETHEPNTFYGVERNPVEKNIIPATWWAGAVGLSGHNANGISFDALLHEGLNIPESFSIRSGRQKTGKATAKDFAVTGRIKYTGIAGLELGATGQYQQDFAQGAAHGGSATLLETHTSYIKGPFGVRALYARWNLDSNSAKGANKDVQEGGYVEASYRLTPKLGAFARYNVWDNGGAGDTEFTQVDLGVNYWLNDHVVFKADYQNQGANDKSKASDGFNLGIGYEF